MTSEQAIQTRVLLVEDEALVRWAGRRILEEAGCLVIDAENIFEAEDEWKRGSFDVVVLDYRLPDGLGPELAGRMRARGNRAPVIFLTAEAERIGVAEAAELGAVAVLRKPLNISELKDALAKACAVAGRAGAASSEVRQSLGGYDIVVCPGRLDARLIESACRGGAANVALNLEGTEFIDDGVIELLVAIAAEKRRAGARICVVGVPEKFRALFVHGGVNRELDVLSSLEELRYLARRATTPSERMSLMDVAVRHDNGV